MRTTLARRPHREEAVALLALLGACSMVPEPGVPPQREGRIEVVYEFDGAAPVPVEVPASGPDLTVLELIAEPAGVRETYLGGRRFLVPPPGTRELRIACRYVIWGDAGAEDPFARAPRIRDAFPGARLLVEPVQD